MYSLLKKVSGMVGVAIQCGCIAHCTFEYIGDFVICNGPSMQPTLYTNNVLLTDRITPRRGTVDRGDIVIAKNPIEPKTHICKRVIGLAGDKITLKPTISWNLFRDTKSSVDISEIGDFTKYSNAHINEDDDQHVSASTANPNLTKRMFMSVTITVPRGHVWLEGDNHENSADSRIFGPVPLGLVKSRVVCRIWPLNEAKLFI